MAAKIIWTFIAAILGILFGAAVIKANLLFGGLPVSETETGRLFRYILLAGTTVLFSAAGLFIGTLNGSLRDVSAELVRVKKRLDDEPQQAEIRKMMEELSANLDHLQDITNNIDEGICVIDRNGLIEYGFNASFRTMFGAEEYTGRSIMETVFRNLTSDLKRELREFIELCFNNTATADSMLNEVSPVARFYYYNSEGSNQQEKIFNSKIVRIKNLAGDVENVMFIFYDITLDETMEIALERHEKAYQDEMSIMTLIYKNDKDMIINFINEANNAVEKVQQRYLEIEQDARNDDLLRGIQGVVHLVKGEAFSLGFTEIAKSAQEIESFVKTVAETVITLENNLTLINLYENLYNDVGKVNTVAQKLFSIGESTRKFSSDIITVNAERYGELKSAMRELLEKFRNNEIRPADLKKIQNGIDNLDTIDLGILEKEIGLVCEKSALNSNVRVVLNFIYDVVGLPQREYRLVKETLVHLIRNTIAHGIEEVSVRRERGKDETGKINIHLYREQSRTIILYSDDGAGFDLEKLKRKAVERGLVKPEELAGMSDNRIIGFAFSEGFSTTEAEDMISGTGIGLSVVRANILHELKGTIAIRNRPEKGISIKLSFP